MCAERIRHDEPRVGSELSMDSAETKCVEMCGLAVWHRMSLIPIPSEMTP